MKKKFLVCALLATAIPLTAIVGCAKEPRSIVSIDKSQSLGLVDYYTITYSDGTTSTFTVTNGKDGQDAPAITVDDVYAYYKQTNPEATKDEFIEKFLTVEGGDSQDNLTALTSLFRSGMKVYTVFKERTYSYLTGTKDTETLINGSAVLYKVEADYAYILTNYHMVYYEKALKADKIFDKAFVYMYGSEYSPVNKNPDDAASEIVVKDSFGLSCEYVGGSVENDVAVLRVSTAELKKAYPYAQAVTVNTSYEVGQTVYALGNPDGAGLSLTRGIISVDIENVLLDINGERYYHLLRTDADLDHGSSGGGLFNAQGEFIALCNSGADKVPSINFAIPASIAEVTADTVIHYNLSDGNDHNGYRMLLGVTVTEANCRYVYDEELKHGNIIADVTVATPDEGAENPISGKPAKAMGLQVGDIIRAVNINGKAYPVNRNYEISGILMRVRVGDGVTITYERDGETKETSSYAVTKDDLTQI